MSDSLIRQLQKLRPLLVFAIVAGLLARVGAPYWARVQQWALLDNDDAMRVLQVRAWLNGQGFYDIINHRLNPPNGGDIHWSRLSDIPLALGELILRPFLGVDMAEKTAAFGVPLILAAIFAYCAARAANIVVKSWAAIFLGAILAIMTPGVIGYFNPGRVDHHGLQLIFLACSFWGLMAHDKKGAMLAGLSIPASLTIGMELTPLLALMVAWVAIVWAINGKARSETTKSFAIWLAIGTIIGFVIDVAPQNYFGTGDNDRMSIAQLLPIIMGSGGLWLASWRASNQTILQRFGVLILIGIAVILVAANFPVLLKPPYWQTNAIMRRLWLAVVSETAPLTKSFKGEVTTLINLGMFVTVTSIAASIKLILVIVKPKKAHKNAILNWSLMAPVLLISTLMMYFWQIRFAGQAAGVAVIAASALLADIFTRQGFLNAAYIGLIINPLVPANVAAIYAKMHPKPKSNILTGGGTNCYSIQAFSELAKMPEGLVASNIDMGARVLLTTHHSALAAPYHRNQGNFTSYDILMSEPSKALEKMHNLNVRYVAYCAKSAEIKNISREAPNGLMAQILANKAPPYLQQIATPKNSDVVAFEVK